MTPPKIAGQGAPGLPGVKTGTSRMPHPLNICILPQLRGPDLTILASIYCLFKVRLTSRIEQYWSRTPSLGKPLLPIIDQT